MKEYTKVWLKNGNIKEIEVQDADVKSYTSDNSLFMLKKESEYCYLIPADNILLVQTVSCKDN